MSLTLLPLPDPDEKAIRDRAIDYAHQSLFPFVVDDDRNAVFRRDAFNQAASLGLSSLVIPKEYGGQGASYHCHLAALEEISKVNLAMTVVIGVTNLVQGAILDFGTPTQKKDYLPKMARGEWLGAFSLSEPQSGSDAAALSCAAKKVDGGYLLNGSKVWCSSAGYADLYLVMTRTAADKTKGITAFLVPKDLAGFRIGKQEKKLGLRASSLAELIFENCHIPEAFRLGDEGEGFKVALSQLDNGRITIGVGAVGLGLAALTTSWRYRQEKTATGWEFSDGEQQILSQYFAELQAARLLYFQAAEMKNRGETITTIASQIKLLGSDIAMRLTSDAITLMGTDGYKSDFHVERMFRDAKALQIVEGTNQIQRLVLSRILAQCLQ